ncbi:MAG: hypothetical protein LQ345_000461 [Seirophora villosa]|nr:MAG: hypothetical protein LQ345_000461 [Seirophora villosa]
MIAFMIQDVLVSPTAKLDISKLVESSPSPSPSPPRPSTSSRPSLSRSFSASVTGSDARFATSPTTSTAHPGPVTNIPVGAADTPRQQRISGPAPVSVPATSVKRTAATNPRESRQANKKTTRQWTKWEDKLVLERRQINPPVTWDVIAAEIPNRTPIACRLRFQNYLERKAEWTDAVKEQLARLYDRDKQKMWSGIAQELKIPWRAVEYMHWEIGQETMAEIAGARLLHPVRPSDDSAPHGSSMQSVFPPGGPPTTQTSFMNTPTSTYSGLPSTAGGPLTQPQLPATTNATSASRFAPGGEETGFAYHRRNRRPGLPDFQPGGSMGPLPSLAEFDRTLQAYASPRTRRRHQEYEGAAESDDDRDQPIARRARR